MKEDSLTQLQTNIEEIINPNMSFYRDSPEDETLYYIDPSTIAKVAYVIIQYAANIFGAIQGFIAAGRWISSRAKKKEARKELVIDNSLLQARIKTLKANLADTNLRSELKKDIQQMLNYHGWPADEADKDSEKIINSFLQ